MISNPLGFDSIIQCRNFNCEIQSLIFPGNKATDQNKFGNCEESRTAEPNWCRSFI